MNPQDFKALLDVLNRIATALEGKDSSVATETVNRFGEVYRMLKELEKTCRISNEPRIADDILKIEISHVEIANQILQINQKK